MPVSDLFRLEDPGIRLGPPGKRARRTPGGHLYGDEHTPVSAGGLLASWMPNFT